MSLIDAINSLIAEREQAAATAQTAADNAAGVADEVNAQLRDAYDAIAAALPFEVDAPIRKRAPADRERAERIRAAAEKFVAAAEPPHTIERIAAHLDELGIIEDTPAGRGIIRSALQSAALVFIKGEGYVPVPKLASVAQAAE